MTYKLISVLLFIVSVSCPGANAHLLNRQDVLRFHLIEKQTDHGLVIRIRGRCALSAYICGHARLDLRDRKQIICVKIPLHLFHPKPCETGYFDLTIKVPRTVKKIVFGKPERQIWPVDEWHKPWTEAQKAACESAINQFKIDEPYAELNDFFVDVREDPTSEDYFTVELTSDGTEGKRFLYSITKKNFKYAGREVKKFGKGDLNHL